jgi:hypothetical protein
MRLPAASVAAAVGVTLVSRGLPLVFGTASAVNLNFLMIFVAACLLLGTAFFLVERSTWKLRRSMAWASLAVVAVGGVLMLVLPEATTLAGSVRWAGMWALGGFLTLLAGAGIGLAAIGTAWAYRER